jgi:hypothetical protein
VTGINSFWTTFLSSIAGSGAIAWAIVRGFGHHLADRWLANHKAQLDKEFEDYRDKLDRKRKRLEAELGHRVYITQTQFDTEFSAMKEIFAALGKLRLSLNGLRPEFSWGSDDDEEKRRVLLSRLHEFKERYNKLVDTAESLYPFVSANIYQHVHECMSRAQIEIMHIETAEDKTFRFEWYQDGAKQRETFDEHYHAAVKLARDHFKHLTIISQHCCPGKLA